MEDITMQIFISFDKPIYPISKNMWVEGGNFPSVVLAVFKVCLEKISILLLL